MSSVIDQTGKRNSTWIVATFPAAPRAGTEQRIIVLPPGHRPLLPQAATQRMVHSAVATSKYTDTWLIPAQSRSGVADSGPMFEFCEIALPDRILGPVRPARPRVEPRHPLVPHLLAQLQRLRRRDDAVGRLLTESTTETLRLHLLDYLIAQDRQLVVERRSLDHAEQARILLHIDNPEADTCVAALAAEVNMSVNAFNVAFVKTFHASPRQFMLVRRMVRAKELLTTSTCSIAEIAVDLGFATPSHFCTTFKNRVGVTPSQYRSTGVTLAS